jgi:hypothetical protein
MTVPYVNLIDNEDVIVRTFSQDVPTHELVWHRDREDRLVTSTAPTNWMVQLDNELPTVLHEIFIPAGVYHRVIKGSGDLTVHIKKSKA